MISVAQFAYSRPEQLSITAPLWLQQKGVDLEMCYSVGPGIKLPDDPRIKTAPIDHCCFVHGNNVAIGLATSDVIFLTQTDMKPQDDEFLAKMSKMLAPGLMVSHRSMHGGQRHPGHLCQCLLLYAADLRKVGGFHEGFCGLYAYEDDDLVLSLLELGLRHTLYECPEDKSMFHIPHNRPDPFSVRERWLQAQALCHKRHGGRKTSEEIAKQKEKI